MAFRDVMLRRRERSESGAAAVEFAFLLIPFVVLIFGAIQFAYYFWSAETTNSAARETARRIVVGDCWVGYDTFAADHGGPGVQSTRLLNDDDPGATAVNPDTLEVGDRIVIEVTSDANLGALPYDFGLPNTVTRYYEARMEVDSQSEPGDDPC